MSFLDVLSTFGEWAITSVIGAFIGGWFVTRYNAYVQRPFLHIDIGSRELVPAEAHTGETTYTFAVQNLARKKCRDISVVVTLMPKPRELAEGVVVVEDELPVWV